jgi:hypothetical protein
MKERQSFRQNLKTCESRRSGSLRRSGKAGRAERVAIGEERKGQDGGKGDRVYINAKNRGVIGADRYLQSSQSSPFIFAKILLTKYAKKPHLVAIAHIPHFLLLRANCQQWHELQPIAAV